jgi:N-acetylneuraminate epimerase
MALSVDGISQESKAVRFKWNELPSLPDKFGFAGCFAGTSNGALMVAGGANFPDGGAPWTGSTKVWSDKLFVLDKPDGHWKIAGKLPKPLGYGVSISWKNKLICIGGSNADGHHSDVFSVVYDGAKLTFETLPDLPMTLANSSGVLIGDAIYIAGGIVKPDATAAADIFWSLDLSKSEINWEQLETWPGPPRMLAVTGASNGSFYIFSGADLHANEFGQPQRRYLSDAYQFTPGKRWKKIADLPQPVVAAPSPAYNTDGLVMIFGGDDGQLASQAQSLKERHPGFSDDILSYNTPNNKWESVGKIKTKKLIDAIANPNKSIWAAVTVPTVIWKGKLVFPSGEVRPAVRTPRVITASL